MLQDSFPIPNNVEITASARPWSVLRFSGKYHIISNASIVNDCIILYNWINNITVTSNRSRLGHAGIDALSLAHNEFVYWPPWFCSSKSSNTPLYPRLKKLDLSGNVIIVPVREAWGCLKHLHTLDLKGNVIQVLGNDTFVDLISLEKLHISYMAKPISQIEPRAFHNKHLKHLHFDNNGMSFRPDSPIPYASLFTFCPNLAKLFLGYNDFRNIADNKFVLMMVLYQN